MKSIIFVIGLLAGSAISENTLLQKFDANGIIKDMKLVAAPEKLLTVSYPSGASVEGVELTPTQVKELPEVKLTGEDGLYYTLLLTDIDIASSSHPNVTEALHWLVVNIEGKDLKTGQTKIEYVGSGPPKTAGIHRYVFLLFQQLNGKQEFDLPTVANTEVKGRVMKVQQMITDFKLKLEAGNFFFAQYDDYVPILHAQLGLTDLTRDEKEEKVVEKVLDKAEKPLEKPAEKLEEKLVEKTEVTPEKTT